jgi:hypothetical protein
VSVVEAPLQIVVVPEMETLKEALTVMLMLELAVQPFDPVTVTVYVPGLTTVNSEVIAAVLHK